MAKINPYVQQYTNRTPRATAEEFGAAKGRAMVGSGKYLAETAQRFAAIEQKRQSRADTIERVRGVRDFNQLAQQEIVRMESEDDMTSTKASENYNNFITQSIDGAVDNYEGSNEGRDRLKTQLITLGGQYSQNAYKMSVSAQYAAVKDEISQHSKMFSATAYSAPDNIGDIFLSIDNTVADLSQALPEGQETVFANSMKADVIKSAARAYIVTGEFDAADKLLSEKTGIILDPNTYRNLKTEIITGKRKLEKDEQEFVIKNKAIELLIGRSTTDEQKERIAGIDLPKTLSEKVDAATKALGRSLTESEVQKIHGVHIKNDKDGFGGSLEGRSITIMNDDVVGFANNVLTPEKEQTFMTAVNHLLQPVKVQNPTTGLWEERIYKLPSHVQEAFARRGIALSRGEQGEVINVTQPLDEEPPEDQSETIWGRRENIAGLVPSAVEFAGQIPFVGEFFEGGGEFAHDRQYATMIQKDLVRILHNNPRYPEGERKAIQEEISILSGFFDTVSAYEERLRAIDLGLKKRVEKSLKTIQSGNVSIEERKHYMNVLNGLITFRQYLGVPPQVKTVEEAEALPPGTQFFSPSGTLMNNTIKSSAESDIEQTTQIDNE